MTAEPRPGSPPGREKFKPTFDESRRYFETRLGSSLPARKEVNIKCRFHDDLTASMSVNLEQGTWFCHACNVGGGILEFERKLKGKGNAECWTTINPTIGRLDGKASKSKYGQIGAVYDYHDAADTLVYQSVRYAEPKDFRQRRPDGKGGWTWGMDGVTRSIFRRWSGRMWCSSRKAKRMRPAEMLPSQIQFNDVRFQLASANSGAPNAVVANGQMINLPAGHYNRIYVLAASASGITGKSLTRRTTSTAR